METLRHKTFVGPTLYLQGVSLNENREAIRALAQAFIRDLGAENVVSICEHAMTFGPFTVVVWYRSWAASEEPAVAQVTNAMIAGVLRRGTPQPAAPVARKEAAPKRPRFRLLKLIAVFLLILYVGSYYHLSRRGMEEAKLCSMRGFLYVPVAEACAKQDLSEHYFRMRLYAPLNWLDHTLFGSDEPGRCLLWGLSK